jgi:multiple sugar transport system substrate-binding protein
MAGIVAASLALAGCGGAAPTPGASGSAPAGGEKVTLRFLWWGNDTRNELTNKVIDLYKSKNPNIEIETQTSDFASYWQLLSTQAAGGDAPDIIQMDEKYLAEYADKGALADLATLGVDASGWAEGTEDAGKFNGTLYAATWAVNSPVFLANKSIFDKAGVELPDDKTWTWDDLASIAKEIQAKGAGEYYGVESMIGVDGATKIWIRQQGGQQFTEDGIGFDAATITPWFEYWKKLQDEGGTPAATATIENQGTALDQALLGTNKLGIGYQWSNQVNAVQNATGQDLLLLRPPTQTGNAADAKLWFKSSMYLSAGANTEHPEEVGKFINFLINDPEAGAILGTERGVPANLSVRETITGDLDAGNAKVVEFMDAISAELGTGGTVPLPGGGQSETIQRRASDQVLLGQLEPAAAAEQFVKELKAEMGLS